MQEPDYCIADRSLPRGPTGYACKDPAKVTTDDFVFTGFRGEKDTTNLFQSNATFAFVEQFSGINGLGLSMARLEAGDVMIFPQYLLHFQTNVGETPALAFVALNGANPGFQITSTALFGGNLPVEIASQITAISPEEVRRLQNVFSEIDTTSYDA
uniref:Germin-like protein n=1 Tax=Chenopodium quinoa TaxID=63459 RepID=A0A803MXC3_CHEQI